MRVYLLEKKRNTGEIEAQLTLEKKMYKSKQVLQWKWFNVCFCDVFGSLIQWRSNYDYIYI
jgi:hypothetical protein